MQLINSSVEKRAQNREKTTSGDYYVVIQISNGEVSWVREPFYLLWVCL